MIAHIPLPHPHAHTSRCAAHTQYGNGYTESSRAVRLFWEVVEGFTPAQRSQLLRFVTSCSRAPLGGFQHLNPPFTIHRVDCGPRNPLAGIVGRDVELLPSARCGAAPRCCRSAGWHGKRRLYGLA